MIITYLVHVLFTFYIQGVIKLKKFWRLKVKQIMEYYIQTDEGICYIRFITKFKILCGRSPYDFFPLYDIKQI